jgi:chromosome segregation ATPase
MGTPEQPASGSVVPRRAHAVRGWDGDAHALVQQLQGDWDGFARQLEALVAELGRARRGREEAERRAESLLAELDEARRLQAETERRLEALRAELAASRRAQAEAETGYSLLLQAFAAMEDAQRAFGRVEDLRARALKQLQAAQAAAVEILRSTRPAAAGGSPTEPAARQTADAAAPAPGQPPAAIEQRPAPRGPSS